MLFDTSKQLFDDVRNDIYVEMSFEQKPSVMIGHLPALRYKPWSVIVDSV